TVNNLGILYKNQGKLAKAEEMYKRALWGYEEAIGYKNIDTYRPALNTIKNIGVLYTIQGKYSEAEEMLSRALLGFETLLGPSGDDCQHVRNNIDRMKGKVLGFVQFHIR
ncbi:hypothetical protein K505DRAFT_256829, partial [Melanomma pulvis-pyrius CBS 109.77]